MAETSRSETTPSTARAYLTPTERYAAGGLFAIALHLAQIHQSRPLTSPLTIAPYGGDSATQERISNCSSGADDIELCVNSNSGLLHPIFRFLEIDSSKWYGLEETAVGSPAKANHDVEAEAVETVVAFD